MKNLDSPSGFIKHRHPYICIYICMYMQDWLTIRVHRAHIAVPQYKRHLCIYTCIYMQLLDLPSGFIEHTSQCLSVRNTCICIYIYIYMHMYVYARVGLPSGFIEHTSQCLSIRDIDGYFLLQKAHVRRCCPVLNAAWSICMYVYVRVCKYITHMSSCLYLLTQTHTYTYLCFRLHTTPDNTFSHALMCVIYFTHAHIYIHMLKAAYNTGQHLLTWAHVRRCCPVWNEV